MFMAFLYPEISKIKNAKKIYLTNYLFNIINTLYDHKMLESYFIRNVRKLLFVLLFLAPLGTYAQILKYKDQKVFFGIFYPSLKKFQWTPKNQKSKI